MHLIWRHNKTACGSNKGETTDNWSLVTCDACLAYALDKLTAPDPRQSDLRLLGVDLGQDLS